MKQALINELYQEKSKIIYRYLLKIGCSHENAEDIVQVTFIKAIQYMVELDPVNLQAWLFKVAINQYYDLCRRENKRPTVTLEEDAIKNMFVEDDPSIHYLLTKEKAMNIQKVIESLSPTYKNLLLLKYEMALSYEQISDITGMGQDKVKTYLYRARGAFKKRWETNINGR